MTTPNETTTTEDRRLPVAGSYLWHESAESDAATVAAAFAAAGLTEYAPPPNSDGDALDLALRRVYVTTRTRYVRQGVVVSGCSVALSVMEDATEAGATKRAGREVAAARVMSDGTIQADDAVIDAYVRARTTVGATAIGLAIRAAVESAGGVIALRSRGGIYWMPPTAAKRARALRAAFLAAGLPVSVTVSTVAATDEAGNPDPEAIGGLVSDLRRQLLADVAEQERRIFGDAASGKKPKARADAREHTRASLVDLEATIATVERVLQTQLDDVRAAVKRAAGAVDLDLSDQLGL